MVEKNLYKLIASFVAIFLYLLLIFAVISYIKSSGKLKKDYGYSEEDAIVVNIDSLLKEELKPVEKLKPEPISKPVIKPEPKKIEPEPKPEPEPEPKPEPEVKKPDPIILPPDPEPVVEPPKPEVQKPEPIILPPDAEIAEENEESRDKQSQSAKDLFSTLRVDDYKKALREKQKQEEARASRLKKQKAKRAREQAKQRQREEAKRKAELKRRKAAAKEAQRLVEQMQISTPSNHRKSGEKHKFWSFVSNKIMSKWQTTISTQDGLSATVTIRIDNQGHLTYSDLKSSYNSLFDTKLKVFLDNLEYERFPSYKDGPFIEAEFEFTDKEKGL